jgi:hypothetical protein
MVPRFDRSGVRPQEKEHPMPRHLGVVLLGLLLLAAARLAALEAVGTLTRIDGEARVIHLRVNGRDRAVPLAPDAQVLGIDGQPLAAGLGVDALKAGAVVTVSVEAGPRGRVVRRIRLGRHGDSVAPAVVERPVTDLKPLTEMTAEDRYQGEDGGLYGGGRNEPPDTHRAAAEKAAAQIVPRDAAGLPAADGLIGLVAISMSNATMEYSLFKQLADRDPRKSPRVVIVDCAQGGQAMAEWVDPDAPAWREADRRLAAARVSPQQVQVLWVKLANKGPSGDLAAHGRKLAKDTLAVLQNAKTRFPHARIAYLGSRIYGGYAGGRLNPEPYAYEGAFAVRWLIQDQVRGAPGLNWDETREPAAVPLLLWGPYFWADGTRPRQDDGLVWERQDLGADGVHPSQSGRRKVADMLLRFFTEDAIARRWFVRE